MGSSRVTIMIDNDLETKLRTRQAQLIKANNQNYSFSQVLNDSLRDYFKKK